MILGGSFYIVLKPVTGDNKMEAVIKINPDHEIFRGHFPGQPVVPGVCMMQIIKELLETSTGKSMRLRSGHDLKFLSVIDPRKDPLVQVETMYTATAAGDFNVTARLFNADTTFFKFKGVFKTS